MNERELRRLLVTAPLPDDLEARRRSWAVVRAAFAQREPVPRRRDLRPALALALVAALVAAAFSSSGEAVIERVRKAIGIERAAPALFRLPASGRLLVQSEAGPWIVHPDGGKRRLGNWTEASWSPFGRFVVVARRDELAAVELDGDVRWKLARPNVRFPRWSGTRTDTRIAYLTRSRLHVVAGDGTGDVDAGGLPAAARVAPAWKPGRGHVLAYATTRGRVYLYDTAAGAVHWRSAPFPEPRFLAWSDDGARLLLVTRDKVAVFRAGSPRPLDVRFVRGVTAAEFAPRSHRVALSRAREVLLLDADRPLAQPRPMFAGGGRFTDATWSPDGGWLLVGWQDADQWVFVRSRGRRIAAVSGIARQFESGRFPSVEGWCCAG